MDGLSYCHQAGVSHRDLKPENLLLDNQFMLKIADFGFAAPVQGKDGSGTTSTKLGTITYMAPEIHQKQKYWPKNVDLFAAAIILFVMVSQRAPFDTATPTDKFYRCLAANRADLFWKAHARTGNFSEELKDLIQSMLQLDPLLRPSINEVCQHPWMKGDVPSEQEVNMEFTKRNNNVKAQQEEERKAKEAEKLSRVDNRMKQAMRGVGDEIGNNEESKDAVEKAMKPQKNLDSYEQVFMNSTEFFSTYNPDMIEDALNDYLRNQQQPEAKNHQEKYKSKFIIKEKDEEGAEIDTHFIMRILKVNDQKVCVEFQKGEGDQVRFMEKFNEIKNGALNFANDAIL